MQEDKQKKAERYLQNMKPEIEEEQLQFVFGDSQHPNWFQPNSPFNDPRAEGVSINDMASPFLHKEMNIDNLTVRSEQREGLATLYDNKQPTFTLRHFFGDNKEQPKQEQAIQESDDDDQASETGRKKFNKGLKLLSVVVQDIVVKKQSTTYKEVANIILNETVTNGGTPLSNKTELAKEEQNIKRRVYDALNVLISAGILLKEGKKVRKNDVNKKIKISSKQLNIKSLRTTILNKKHLLEQKTQKLEKLTNELDSIKRLIARNKSSPGQKYISFPFMIVKPSTLPNTTMDIKKQADCLKFAVYSNREFSVYGDMEMVAMIKPTLPPL